MKRNLTRRRLLAIGALVAGAALLLISVLALGASRPQPSMGHVASPLASRLAGSSSVESRPPSAVVTIPARGAPMTVPRRSWVSRPSIGRSRSGRATSRCWGTCCRRSPRTVRWCCVSAGPLPIKRSGPRPRSRRSGSLRSGVVAESGPQDRKSLRGAGNPGPEYGHGNAADRRAVGSRGRGGASVGERRRVRDRQRAGYLQSGLVAKTHARRGRHVPCLRG